MRLESDVTLICVDTLDCARDKAALVKCLDKVPFKNVRFIGPCNELNTSMPLSAYSDFCIRHLHEYFETSHCLIVQHDGWICNGSKWQDSFLDFDFVGCIANWSEPSMTGKGGCGGFSLRSRRLMELASRIAVNTHPEDVVLSRAKPHGQREDFEAAGMVFAPNSVQRLWGFDNDRYTGEFGHHRARDFGPYPERCAQV